MLLHVTILLRELVDEVSADSRFQLDLEIALNVVSAKIQPHELFSPGRRCVETSGDVISPSLGAKSRKCRANSCKALPYVCRPSHDAVVRDAVKYARLARQAENRYRKPGAVRRRYE